MLAPAREPAAEGASNTNRSGCELSELGELRAARSQLRFLVGGSAWSQGAQHRRYVATREVVFTAAVPRPQSSRSCAVRRVCVFARGGVSIPSSLLFARPRSIHQRARVL